MVQKYAMKADVREQAGKGVARALRRESKVPAVIYGDGKEPVKITLSAKEINIEYNKGHMFSTLCDLEVGGDKNLVLARDVQLHPVRDYVEHVDFLRVTAKTKLTVAIPVQFINEDKCPGITDEKGILNILRYEVDLVCSAMSIPDAIEMDLSSFQMGDAIKMSDAVLPEGSTPAIADRDFTIATIAAPRAAVEEEPAEGEEGEDAEGEEGEASESGDGESAEGGEEKSEGGGE